MVHYVRFLKTPRLSHGKTVLFSCLVTITTDLGESFLAADVDLELLLVDEKSGRVILQKTVTWRTGYRDLAITFDRLDIPLKGQLLSAAIRVSLRSSLSNASHDDGSIPSIVGAHSAPFQATPGSPAPALVERTFALEGGQKLNIWEETGNSIALHIWDAAIGVLQSVHGERDDHEASGDDSLRTLIDHLHQPARILELGAGCGIVGIALATLFESLSVTLTDLPDAMEIMQKNISIANPARGSGLSQAVLDWDTDLPPDVVGNLDMVMVSDCTYNADALPSLVQVLWGISKTSPHVLIVVAMKRRHDSEEVFFDLIRESFQQVQFSKMSLPHVASDYDTTDNPSVEIYCYKAKTSL